MASFALPDTIAESYEAIWHRANNYPDAIKFLRVRKEILLTSSLELIDEQKYNFSASISATILLNIMI
jgi:hypothetical protein